MQVHGIAATDRGPGAMPKRLAALAVLGLAPALAWSGVVGSFSDDFTLAQTGYRSIWSNTAVSGFTKSASAQVDAAGSTSAGFITGSAPRQVCSFPLIGSAICSLTDDTRSGATVGIAGSGLLSLSTSSTASGGGIKVALPASSTLSITQAATNTFQVRTTGRFRGESARIDVQAPSFGFNVGMTLDASVILSGTGCVAFAGCMSDATSLRVPVNAPKLISLNTAAASPVTVLGQSFAVPGYNTEYVYRKGSNLCDVTHNATGCSLVAGPALVHLTLRPLLGATGTGLSLQTRQDVLTVNADLLGIAQALGGVPIDVLNPSIGLAGGLARVSGKTVDPEAGLILGYEQNYRVDLSAARMAVTLTFDEPVQAGRSELLRQPCPPRPPGQIGIGCVERVFENWVFDGPVQNTVTFALGETGYIRFADGTEGNLLSRRYSWLGSTRPTLVRDDDITIDPDVRLRVGCFRIDLPVDDTGESCVADETERTTGLLEFDAFDRQFKLWGWQPVTFLSPPPAGVPVFMPTEAVVLDEPPPGEDLPLPATPWMVALGLALAARRQRRT